MDGGAAAGDAEWLATLEFPPPHAASAATVSRVAIFVSAGARGSVPIRKGNDIVRTRLRFRYHPRSEAGRRPSPPGFAQKGSQSRARAERTEADGRCAVRFVLSGWRNRATLNLAEVLTHTV